MYISKSVELARHLAYVQPRIPDVLTAGIRDNGNLARVYSGESWGWGIGVWFLFHFFEATSSCHRPSALFPLLIGFPFPFLNLAPLVLDELRHVVSDISDVSAMSTGNGWTFRGLNSAS